MEAAVSSETSLHLYQKTRRHITEDGKVLFSSFLDSCYLQWRS